jgi:hypothetical protein
MVSHEQGLQNAYNTDSGLFQDGGTLYVAGTRSLDHVKEWWKIPAFKTKDSDIYHNTSKYLQEHPEVDNLVGHSYGGSVVLEMQKGDKKYKTTTYGAPVFDPIPRNPLHTPRRFCNYYDPVCALDMGASKSKLMFSPNPHSYRNTPKPADGSRARNYRGYSTLSHGNSFVLAH